MAQTTDNKFSTIINQALLQYTVAFQAGQTLAPEPADFENNLTQQLRAWDKNWPDSADDADQQRVDDAVTAYTSIYNEVILALPLPNNPTDAYQSWYDGAHAK